MNHILPLLATASGEEGVSTWYKMSDVAREWIIILAALASVTLLALGWALFFRKRRSLRPHHAHEWTDGPDAAIGNNTKEIQKKRRKWRRRRRDHRPRNPTLAETGGLPPARSEGPRETPL
jgi:hypothetical protein